MTLLGGASKTGIQHFVYYIQLTDELSNARSWDGVSEPATSAYRKVKLTRLDRGYGSEGLSAQLTLLDDQGVPGHGSAARIFAETGRITDTLHPIFTGFVDSQHLNRQTASPEFSLDLRSDIVRLNDPKVTFTSNVDLDPLNPSPIFDRNGTPRVIGRDLTVYEIVEQIMEFEDAWGSTEFFNFDDIDWHGLDDDPECGKFVPGQVNFTDTGKGKAIEEVLARAGDFRIYYSPVDNKIHITEINLKCNRCGPLWDVRFPPSGLQIQTSPQMAYDFDVVRDNTVWSTKTTANVCRITSRPIQFYSGHYMMPEIYGTVDQSENLVNDLESDQVDRVKNFEGANYRFTTPHSAALDFRKDKKYYVGMPLFPDWNIFQDWFPYLDRIDDVILPSNIDDSERESYRGQVEYSSLTVGDYICAGARPVQYTNNLSVYQAWHIEEKCPACNGTGHVKSVYTGTNNEPNFTIVDRTVPGSIETYKVLQVDNWIMNPSDFGGYDDDGNRLSPPAGLKPYSGSDYPIPWKNTCPYCRGVGWKPEYRINSIRPSLFSARAMQVTPSDLGLGNNPDVLSVDPTYTAVGPETLQQAQNRVRVDSNVQVQIEASITTASTSDQLALPAYAHRNDSFKDLRDIPESEKVHEFPNPLALEDTQKALDALGLGREAEESRKVIAPDNYKCVVNYTTILLHPPSNLTIDHKLGRFIFDSKSPPFISCRKQFHSHERGDNHKAFVVGEDGLLSTSRPQPRQNDSKKASGYWRPAKIWATFFYERPSYFNRMEDGYEDNEVEVSYKDADGDNNIYKAKAILVDGKYCLEVKKKNPDHDDDTDVPEFPNGKRVIQSAISGGDAVIEIFEGDLKKMAIPVELQQTDEEYLNLKEDKDYSYAKGRILKIDNSKPGENLWEHAGYTDVEFYGMVNRPRTLEWTLRDHRQVLLEKAVRHLETTNNMQVNGSIVINNYFPPVDDGKDLQGLGWVDYPDRGRAIVERVTYKFDRGLKAELELTRKESRFGEMPLDKDQMINNMDLEIRQLVKIADAQAAQANMNFGGGSYDQTTSGSTRG